VKGRRPRPLDDGGLRLKSCHFAVATTRNYTGFSGFLAKSAVLGAS
jgi:hypothetical protein